MNNRFDFKNIKTLNDYMSAVMYNHQIFTGNYIGKMGYEQYLFNINIGYIPKDSIYCYNTGKVYSNIAQI